MPRCQERLHPHVSVALPSFESYRRAHSKAGFSRLPVELDLPQPATRFVTSPAELRDAIRPPCVVKASIATASRGIWLLHDSTDTARILREIEATGAFEDVVLVQEFVQGPIEHAQAVFHQGRLLAMHAYRQLLAGAGGGPALKDSVERPTVEAHLAEIGRHLAWHGALSVDYVLADAEPRYIDCNPRLVEPMSAALAGLDLADLLVRVSQGERPASVPRVAPGRARILRCRCCSALHSAQARGGNF